MGGKLEPDQLRSFAKRDWRRVRAAKERFWAEDARERGPAGGLRAGEALWIHARTVDPSWPDPPTRRRDLEHHLRMRRLLDRLVDVFPRS